MGEQTAATAAEFRAVRKVLSVSQTRATRTETTLANKRFDITIERAFPFSDAGQDIRRVNDDVADLERFLDNYKEIGPAEVVTFGGSAPPEVELAASILPSNISANAATNAIESRLYGEVDTRVNRYDIHVIGPAPVHVVIRNIARVEETGRVTRSSNFGAYSSYYFLYWAAVVNHTGSDVTVRSQAASQPQPYALRELSDDSDVFAAKIDPIPTRVTTDWSAFPDADAGETVTLTTTGGYTAAGYSGLKVKRPSGDAPDIRSGGGRSRDGPRLLADHPAPAGERARHDRRQRRRSRVRLHVRPVHDNGRQLRPQHAARRDRQVLGHVPVHRRQR